MLNNIAFIFLIVGVAVALFGGGVPIGGFKRNKELLDCYLISKEKGEKPTQDQQGAYYTVLCYKVGGGMIVISVFLYFLNMLSR